MNPLRPQTELFRRLRLRRLRARIAKIFTLDETDDPDLVELLFGLEDIEPLEPRVRRAAAKTDESIGPLGHDDPEWLLEFLRNIREPGTEDRS